MAVILFKGESETTMVEPKVLQNHLDAGWRLTKEIPITQKKRGPKAKVAKSDVQED